MSKNKRERSRTAVDAPSPMLTCLSNLIKERGFSAICGRTYGRAALILVLALLAFAGGLKYLEEDAAARDGEELEGPIAALVRQSVYARADSRSDAAALEGVCLCRVAPVGGRGYRGHVQFPRAIWPSGVRRTATGM